MNRPDSFSLAANDDAPPVVVGVLIFSTDAPPMIRPGTAADARELAGLV